MKSQQMNFFANSKIRYRYIHPETKGEKSKADWRILVRKNGVEARVARANRDGSATLYSFNVELPASVTKGKALFNGRDTNLSDDLSQTNGGRIFLPSLEEYEVLLNAMKEAKILSAEDVKSARAWMEEKLAASARAAKPGGLPDVRKYRPSFPEPFVNPFDEESTGPGSDFRWAKRRNFLDSGVSEEGISADGRAISSAKTMDDLPSGFFELLRATTGAEEYIWILSALKRHAGPLIGKRILEIGSGFSPFLLLVRDLGLTVQGLESNTQLAELARSQGLPVEHGDVLHLPAGFLTGEGFDITFSRNVLDVVKDTPFEESCSQALRQRFRPDPKTVKEALASLAMLTKPGGLSAHEVEYDWGLVDQDFIDAGFDILEGGAQKRFVVLRRKPPSNRPSQALSNGIHGMERSEEAA